MSFRLKSQARARQSTSSSQALSRKEIYGIKDYAARALKGEPKRFGQKRSSFGAWIRVLSALLGALSIPKKHLGSEKSRRRLEWPS